MEQTPRALFNQWRPIRAAALLGKRGDGSGGPRTRGQARLPFFHAFPHVWWVLLPSLLRQLAVPFPSTSAGSARAQCKTTTSFWLRHFSYYSFSLILFVHETVLYYLFSIYSFIENCSDLHYQKKIFSDPHLRSRVCLSAESSWFFSFCISLKFQFILNINLCITLFICIIYP